MTEFQSSVIPTGAELRWALFRTEVRLKHSVEEMRVICMEYKAALDKLEDDNATVRTYLLVYNAIAYVVFAASTEDDSQRSRL